MENGTKTVSEGSITIDTATSAINHIVSADGEVASMIQEIAEELSHLSEELQMAASHFVTKSADDFIRCWDIKKCSNENQKKCPAYDSKETRCWLVEGTWCGGVKQGDAKAKIHNCMNCEAFKKNTDA